MEGLQGKERNARRKGRKRKRQRMEGMIRRKKGRRDGNI
jgi:hypothetical protein